MPFAKSITAPASHAQPWVPTELCKEPIDGVQLGDAARATRDTDWAIAVDDVAVFPYFLPTFYLHLRITPPSLHR